MTSPPPLVSFVGPSGAGKTTLLEGLVREMLRRGRRVACLKHSHHRDLLPDASGSDTHRLTQAGAAVTGLSAPGLLCLWRTDGGEWPLPSLATLAGEAVDLVLTEGYGGGPAPKVLVLGPGQSPPELPPDLLAVVGPCPPGWKGPLFAPDQVRELADLLEERLGLGSGERA
ncbi:MAG TPA: molybdopterin-guanine dinucleotide biosynthesis protein MobB [Dehalococcoidia bacterium]|nr:molybdopterin-guanine dinucleotide biosynthesis protein MobB [Dehalococcoidia bacterium]